MAVTALYAVALVRRVPHALHWLTMATATARAGRPEHGQFPGKMFAAGVAAGAAGRDAVVAAIRYRSGLHGLLAAVCAIAAVCIFWPQAIGTRWFGAIPVHLMLFAMLLIGAVLHDRVARFLQRIAVLGMPLACLFIWSGEAERWSTARPVVFMLYPGVMLAVATVYAYWIRNPWYRVIPLLILAGWMVDLGGRGYGSLRKSVAGLDELAWGMACLLVGLLVSLWKLGLPQAWLAWF